MVRDLLDLLAFFREGKGKWSSDVTCSVWQQVPQWGLRQGKRTRKRLGVQIPKKADLLECKEPVVVVSPTSLSEPVELF